MGIPHVQGMYKSKLVCPQCSFVGVKFDPYMYLSLNLPESKSRTLQVTAVYVDGAQPPMQHAVDVPKTGDIPVIDNLGTIHHSVQYLVSAASEHFSSNFWLCASHPLHRKSSAC